MISIFKKRFVSTSYLRAFRTETLLRTTYGGTKTAKQKLTTKLCT